MALDGNNVLVAGIYLTDRANTAAATIAEFSRSREWSVTHRWPRSDSSGRPRNWNA
jgi:hypothetical protein